MPHSSATFILARRLRLQGTSPIPAATLSSRPNGSKPHFARSPSVQPAAWSSIPRSSLRQLSESFHRLQRLAHPRPRWRWAVPLRLRPLRMTDLSAGECLVRLTDRADTPYSRLLRSLTFRTALRCVIDSATPAVQGGLLTAGAGAHPARCTGIGLVLRPQPDPVVTQARCSIVDCPATPASRLALTMPPLILCLHFIPSAPRCFRCAQGYRCCEPWAHSSLCRHSALPCLRFTAHRHRQSATSSLEQVQGTMLSHSNQRY